MAQYEKPGRSKCEKMLMDAKKLMTQLNNLFTALAIECENQTKIAREKKAVDPRQ
jgi:hypothetical protein